MSTATSVAQGLKMARSMVPDVILLDLNLPDTNGDVLLTELDQHETLRDIPVVVISSNAYSYVENLLKRRNVAGFLVKPTSDEELHRAIVDALNLRQMRQFNFIDDI